MNCIGNTFSSINFKKAYHLIKAARVQHIARDECIWCNSRKWFVPLALYSSFFWFFRAHTYVYFSYEWQSERINMVRLISRWVIWRDDRGWEAFARFTFSRLRILFWQRVRTYGDMPTLRYLISFSIDFCSSMYLPVAGWSRWKLSGCCLL